MLNAEAGQESSCIFFGNIPYDATDDELKDTFKMAGPFQVFRLKIDPKNQQPMLVPILYSDQTLTAFGFFSFLYQDLDIMLSFL